MTARSIRPKFVLDLTDMNRKLRNLADCIGVELDEFHDEPSDIDGQLMCPVGRGPVIAEADAELPRKRPHRIQLGDRLRVETARFFGWLAHSLAPSSLAGTESVEPATSGTLPPGAAGTGGAA